MRLLPRLLEAGPPIETDGWSIEPDALELVLAEVSAGRERIVECGSGLSTIVIARLLRERGRGTLHALEHDPAWIELTSERIAAEGLEGHARVVAAPLADNPLAPPGCRWYARGALAELPDGGVDLLFVDGPPASPERAFERSRYPALPLLADRLARGARVLLDDAERAGERWVVERWERELGTRFERDRGIARASLSRTALLRARAVRSKARAGQALSRGEPRAWARRRTGLAARDASIRALERGQAEAYTHLERIYGGLANHEQRIRRIAELDAVSTWIEQATLAREPLISVITAAHRRPEPLDRAIRSVLDQTYSNWEHVVVVDGANEEVVAVAERAGDKRVRCLPIAHGGGAVARNRGLAEARGEVIAYLDDDNSMHPGWLKSVAWALAQRPDVDVLYGGWLVDDPGRLYGGEGGRLPEYWITPFDRELQRRQALADMSAIAHRAGLAEAHFDPELPGYHDWDLLARLTADREPLVLPAIAAYYTTDGPDRRSARLDHDQIGDLVRAKMRPGDDP